MPTITRARRPIDSAIPHLSLTQADREKFAECAGLDHRARSGRAFLNRVEQALAWHLAMLQRAPQRAEVPHIIAALKPIAAKVGEAAKLLHPQNLAKEVGAVLLDVDVAAGQAHRYLLDIATAAEQAIADLAADNPGPGYLFRRLNETRARAMSELEAIYRDLAVERGLSSECDAGDLKEFLDLCECYLSGQAGDKHPSS